MPPVADFETAVAAKEGKRLPTTPTPTQASSAPDISQTFNTKGKEEESNKDNLNTTIRHRNSSHHQQQPNLNNTTMESNDDLNNTIRHSNFSSTTMESRNDDLRATTRHSNFSSDLAATLYREQQHVTNIEDTNNSITPRQEITKRDNVRQEEKYDERFQQERARPSHNFLVRCEECPNPNNVVSNIDELTVMIEDNNANNNENILSDVDSLNQYS